MHMPACACPASMNRDRRITPVPRHRLCGLCCHSDCRVFRSDLWPYLLIVAMAPLPRGSACTRSREISEKLKLPKSLTKSGKLEHELYAAGAEAASRGPAVATAAVPDNLLLNSTLPWQCNSIRCSGRQCACLWDSCHLQVHSCPVHPA